MRKHDKKKKAALFRKWQLSGERKADFSTRHGIRRSTFYLWTKSLKKSEANWSKSGFYSSKLCRGRLGIRTTFLEIQSWS
jgi:transposase-like protein